MPFKMHVAALAVTAMVLGGCACLYPPVTSEYPGGGYYQQAQPIIVQRPVYTVPMTVWGAPYGWGNAGYGGNGGYGPQPFFSVFHYPGTNGKVGYTFGLH